REEDRRCDRGLRHGRRHSPASRGARLFRAVGQQPRRRGRRTRTGPEGLPGGLRIRCDGRRIAVAAVPAAERSAAGISGPPAKGRRPIDRPNMLCHAHDRRFSQWLTAGLRPLAKRALRITIPAWPRGGGALPNRTGLATRTFWRGWKAHRHDRTKKSAHHFTSVVTAGKESFRPEEVRPT